MADLKLNQGATEIFLPEFERKYTQGWLDFEVSERTINRTLVSDFVGFKRTFSVTWNVLEGEIMSSLILLYLTKQDVIFSEQQPDGSFLSWTCKLSISQSLLREIDAGNFAFSGFSITLEEV
jgi:hypothetical protein